MNIDVNDYDAKPHRIVLAIAGCVLLSAACLISECSRRIGRTDSESEMAATSLPAEESQDHLQLDDIDTEVTSLFVSDVRVLSWVESNSSDYWTAATDEERERQERLEHARRLVDRAGVPTKELVESALLVLREERRNQNANREQGGSFCDFVVTRMYVRIIRCGSPAVRYLEIALDDPDMRSIRGDVRRMLAILLEPLDSPIHLDWDVPTVGTGADSPDGILGVDF